MRYPNQSIDCQRFEGQTFTGQHRKPERIINACKCGICSSQADKLSDGTYVCCVVHAHIANGIVGIWSDLTFPNLKGGKAYIKLGHKIALDDCPYDIGDIGRSYWRIAVRNAAHACGNTETVDKLCPIFKHNLDLP